MLRALLRSWKARYPVAGVSAKETATAKAAVARETAARLAAAPPPPPSPAAVAGNSGKGNRAGGGGDSCPIVEGSTTVTATTTRSAVAWGGGAAASAASKSSGSSAGSSSGGGGSGSGSSTRGGRFQGARTGTAVVQDDFWCWPLKFLAGGEAALKRQVEGGVSSLPPGARSRDKLSPDLNLSRPWTPKEADRFTQALLQEGSKNFHAVQVNQAPETDLVRREVQAYAAASLDVRT